MSAAQKTIEWVRTTDYLERTVELGDLLRSGLKDVSAVSGLNLSQTGPSQMPLIMVCDDSGKRDLKTGSAFAGAMIRQGVYFHPFHNMFISAAMTSADIERTIDVAHQAAKEVIG